MPRTDTRDRILQAAAELIHSKGYGGTTIEDVLEASGVKKGNLYYYFASKEELGLAVLDYYRDSHAATVRSFLDNPEMSAREGLNQWLVMMSGRMAEMQCSCGCPFGNLALELSDHSEVFRQRIAKHFAAWEDIIAQAVRAAQAAGDCHPDLVPEEFAAYSVTLLEGAIMMCKLTRQIRPIERAVADIRNRLDAPVAQPA